MWEPSNMETQKPRIMNGPSNTWVDLLSKDSTSKRAALTEGRVTVTPNTPRTRQRYPRLTAAAAAAGEQGQAEILRSQVVSLLQEKQELTRKVQKEKNQREQLERDIELLKAKRINHKSVTFHDGSSSTTPALQLQVSALREALEQTTQERNTLRGLLSKEKDCSTLLESQLTQERSKNEKKMREKEIELDGLRAQLKQLRQELNTMIQLVKKKSKDDQDSEQINNQASTTPLYHVNTLEHLQEQLTEKDELLVTVERERDALRERLTAVETQRQLSMEQYQEEVETSVMAVTTQLEELLELNQQLQEELTSVQTEKDELNSRLEREAKSKELLNQEKDQQLTRYEQTVSELTAQLGHAREAYQQQITTQQESNHSELSLQLELTKRELERQVLATDKLKLDLSHRNTLLEQEKQMLLNQLDSIKALNNKIKTDCKRLEEETRSLQNDLTKCQRDKGTCEAQLITVRAELSTTQEYCTQLRKEMSDLRDTAMSHSRQQVESLSQQLVHKSQQLQEVETERKLLQNKVRKMESDLQEAALGLSQHQQDVQTLTNDYTSQLELAQTSNHQLQQKVIELEKDAACQKKQALEQLDQMTSVDELRKLKISELEETIDRLSQELSDSHKENDRGHALLSQVRTLQESVVALQTERESLEKKLKSEMEHSQMATEAEQQLRQENTKLQELLNSSLSLNEKLQSSADESLSSPPAAKNNSLKLSPISSSQVQTPPPSYSPSPQFASPAAEIVHLKQQLANARQTCLKLERQQAQDMTEMARVKGSLQALVKIQEHLSGENKSLGQTFGNLEEEKDAYKQEAKRLSSELVTSQVNLETINSEVDQFLGHLLNQLHQIVDEINPLDDSHSQLLECHQILNDGGNKNWENLKVATNAVESLVLLLLEKSQQLLSLELDSVALNEKIQSTDNRKLEEIAALQERVSTVCGQLKLMEEELERKENELQEKERQLLAVKVELSQQEDAAKHKTEESFRKDLETQYQAKLAVLRGQLMEREDEVNCLQATEQELKTQLSEAKIIVTSAREELSTAKEESIQLREILAHCEASLTSETGFIENEAERQEHAVMTMKSELTKLNSSTQQAQSINHQQESQLRSCDERIFELQAQVEMLRAKKLIFDKYMQSNEEQGTTTQQRDELLQENMQLSMENDDLKQELVSLGEMTQHMQDQVDILVLRLQEVQEEADHDREIDKQQLEETHHRELQYEVERMKRELQTAQDEFQNCYSLLESKLERSGVLLHQTEAERDTLVREIQSMRVEMSRQQQEVATLTDRLSDRDTAIADIQSSLEHALTDREVLEIRLNESCPNNISIQNNRKVDKLKVKLKQQVLQTNHIRLKLGYALSELRLYKQLKKELDCQVNQLQQALTLTRQQYEESIDKLNQADISNTFSHEI